MDSTTQKKKENKIQKLMGFSTNEKIALGALLTLIILAPYFFTQFSSGISFIGSGEIGDTIGGITAPFVNLLAAFLVYKSFSAQIEANEQQRKDHREQMDLLTKEHHYTYTNFMFNEFIKDFELTEQQALDGLGLVQQLFIMMEKVENRNLGEEYPPELNQDFVENSNASIKERIIYVDYNLGNIYRMCVDIFELNSQDTKLGATLTTFYRNKLRIILTKYNYFAALTAADKIRKKEKSFLTTEVKNGFIGLIEKQTIICNLLQIDKYGQPTDELSSATIQ